MPAPRPDLKVVRGSAVGDEGEQPGEVGDLHEDEAGVGAPALDGEELATYVAPQAPLDVRVREWVLGLVKRLPRVWTERPASCRERVEYSLSGDWTTSDNTLLRVGHLLLTVLVCFPAGLLGASLLSASQRPAGLAVVALYVVLLRHVL